MKLRLPFLLCFASLAASPATSTVWEVNGFSDFLKGRLSNLSLTSEGTLQPGPVTRWNTPLDQPALWAIAEAPDGSMYAATGHSGKVYKISPNGKASLLWASQQTEVFALCVDAKGALYAGTSPNGAVYKIEGTNARKIWPSPAKYIWALRPASDGSLFIATGEQGRIYRLTPGSSSADVYYETGQANVTALALAPNGRLYAGTDPNGILYEITAPKTGNILYDSTLPEIRAIAIDSKGMVYAAAMGGAIATRTAAVGTAATSQGGAAIATSPTVITVTDAKENSENAENDQSGLKVSTDPNKNASSQSSATVSTSSVVEVSGVEKSAIYRISPDRTVETLRSSKEDNVYDLLLSGDSLLFSTDEHGRIYRWADHSITLLAEPGSGETTRLLKIGDMLYAAMSNPARLLAFSPEGSGSASYESVVHDATSVARWGHLQWHGNGSGISFRTRTGNTARPDATWSDWSEPLTGSGASLIQSPVNRFIQWRAEWPAGSAAQISTVDVPFLPQNGAPAIHSITVSSIINTNPAKSSGASTNSSSSSAYSITVTDTGEAPAASTASSGNQTVSRLQTTQTQISWQADDPDNDKLVYSVYFRAEDQTSWQLIRSRMFENTLLLDPDVLADGRYYFKVTASDAPSNSAEFVRQSELSSSPVLIDNTPPAVSVGKPRRTGSVLDIDIEGNDNISPLRLCEYSLDAGFWQPIEATDGVTDSQHERFHLHLETVRPGEHLLVFRVYDAANNAGLGKVVLH